MRRAARVDANQPAIVAGLRAAGATILHMHPLGQGAPDVAVGYRDRNYFLELKSTGGKLTNDEAVWHATWRGQVATVYTLEEALAVIGAI